MAQGINNPSADFSNLVFTEEDINNLPPTVEPVKPTEVVPPAAPPAAPVSPTDPVPPTDDKKADEFFVNEGDENLVDGTGKVIAKKGEYTLNADGTITLPETPLIKELTEAIKAKGYSVPADVEYPDNVEGYLKLAETIAESDYNNKLSNLYKTFPVIEKLTHHLLAGQNVNDFAKQLLSPSYKDVNVPVEDKAGRKAIIENYLTTVANNDKETTTALIKLYEDGGQIDTIYDKAINALKDNELAQERKQLDDNKKAIQDAEQEKLTYWKGVKAVIDKGELDAVVIPAAEKEQFYNFIALSADKSGKSQLEAKYQALPEDKKLLLDYLVFKDLNLDGIIKRKVEEARVLELKRRKVTITPASATPNIKATGTNALEGFKFDSLQ